VRAMADTDDRGAVERRKEEHLDLAAREEVEAPGTDPLFGEVHLVHEALPERALAEVDLSVELLGKRLRTPLFVTGMTGGTEGALAVNRAVAAAAEAVGAGLGVGSMRAVLEDPSLARTFRVREVAPTALLVANLGAWQLAEVGTDGARRLCGAIGADALAIHLNAAQELAQPEGDRDFRGALSAIGRLCRELGLPVVVKETGCGISRATARRLVEAGVAALDVAGAGGTSWPAVEALRAGRREVGEALSAWGIPTAASVAACADLGVPVIASGGLRSGVDAAKALALGATAAGFARPLLLAAREGGAEAATAALASLDETLRGAALLAGAGSLAELRRVPRVIGPRLREWWEVLAGPTGSDRTR
jgi:isopentenyl-diphosphate delta-isomerase